MKEEQELGELVEEQRADDTPIQMPQRFGDTSQTGCRVLSLDEEVAEAGDEWDDPTGEEATEAL